MEQRFYICRHCGNIIAKVKDSARHVLRRENGGDNPRHDRRRG